jgi:hypothetical protein
MPRETWRVASRAARRLGRCKHFEHSGRLFGCILSEHALQNNPTEILSNYAYATQLDPDWYKGWHTWALANFEVITYLEVQKTVLAADAFNVYIKPAVQGEFPPGQDCCQRPDR